MEDDYAWLSFAKSDESVLDTAIHPSIGDWTTPLPNVIFWLGFKAFGFDPRGYFVVIAIIHLFNSWLVYRLVNLVTDQASVAYSSALIFALHFAHFSDWGPLVWISAFIHPIVAASYLITLALFFRYLSFGKRSAYVGALICFGIALASKETAMTIPLLLLVWCLIRLPSGQRRWTRVGVVVGPFWALLGAYLLYKLLVQKTSDRYLEDGLYRVGEHLITNWKYFSNLVMPNPQSPPVQSFLLRSLPVWAVSIAQLAATVVRLGLLLPGIALWRRGPYRVRLWIAMSLITYLPFIAFAGGYAGANRYFYLPIVGFSALLASGLGWLFDRISQNRGRAIATSLLALAGLGLWTYNLIPIRTWQREMRTASEPVQQAIKAVGEETATRGTSIANVYLLGFPSRVIRNTDRAMQLIFDADAVSVAPEQIDEIELATNGLLLVYESQRVVIHHP